MTDGEERPGMQAACDAALEAHGDHQAHDEALFDAGAHASLEQQAAFARACLPKDGERPGLEQAQAAFFDTDYQQDPRSIQEWVYDAGRTQGQQETLLACAEERVLAASQPMSGEVRRELEALASWLKDLPYTKEPARLNFRLSEITHQVDRILAMGTRADLEVKR